ncbi:MAG: hypothetical protein IJ833_02020 [Lachnospiraceae bacterium]|nr:hypothetical protein [Lachnospiraceae bacterium]
MNKKFAQMILLVILVTLLPACKTEAVEMPNIVFLYYDRQEVWKETGTESIGYTYSIYFCDKYGNIYSTQDEKYTNWDVLQRDYDLIAEDETCEIRKRLDSDEVRSQYKILQDIANGEQNTVQRRESNLDAFQGSKQWQGCCYDKEGNLIVVELYETGDYISDNEDTRAYDLAMWMWKVM